MTALLAPEQLAPPSRYTVLGEIASGGMATIQYGRLLGPGGFARAVAIKRLHPHYAKDESFVSMFLDEARLSARIAHSNVVQTYDVITEPGELAVVMEYVHGESLASLLEHVSRRGERIPVEVTIALLIGTLHGLHAAHETRGEHDEPLHIIHRDVSPENILVGVDGVARLIDFGIARAKGRSRATPAGQLKGKLAYMACEQYRGGQVDRRVDVYGASVVLWEALTGRPLFRGESDAAVVASVLHDHVPAPSHHRAELPAALDDIVLKGLSRDPAARFETARAMALALEREVGGTTQSVVADWLEGVAGETLARRQQRIDAMRRQAAPSAPSIDGADGGTRPIDRSAVTRAVSEPPTEAWTETASAAHKSGLRVRPSARRGMVAAIGIGACVVGLAAWGARMRYAHDDEAAAPTRAAEPAQVAAPTPAPSPKPASVPTPTASRQTAPIPAPTSETAQPMSAVPDAGPPKRAARTPRSGARKGEPRAPSASRKERKVDCTHPFVVDQLGIRHVKLACLD